jgi:HrpA-like RNA helicase
LAERVALEMGFTLGEEIGYCVRFEERRSQKTRVTFMTDGMAIRELMAGRMFDVFVLDEAHERSINTDVLMALLRARMQAGRRVGRKVQSHRNRVSDFRLVVMSATIEPSKFMNFFDTGSVVRVEGRTYPTQIYSIL